MKVASVFGWMMEKPVRHQLLRKLIYTGVNRTKISPFFILKVMLSYIVSKKYIPKYYESKHKRI